MMKKRKILHAIASTNPELGGVSQALRTIIACLTNNDIHNEVVSLDPPDAFYNHANNGVIVHSLGPPKSSWQYNKKLLPWLIENLKNYDVVVVHGIWLYHGYAINKAINYLKNGQSPVGMALSVPTLLVFPHGMLDPYFQNAPGRKLKSFRNKIYWKFIEKKIVNEADAVLFTTNQERVLSRQSFFSYYPKREIVVGMSVDEPPSYQSIMRRSFLVRFPQIKDSSYILFLSRLHPKKGVDILIKAYSEVTSGISSGKQMPKLVIAGPGLDTHYGRKMQRLASKYSNNILFTGMLVGIEKWGAFYGCDAFILPTHQENFGIAIVEALACGKPVLISNQTNIWEEVARTKCGIVESDTIVGTANLFKKWLSLSLSEKEKYGIHAKELYKTHFSLGSMEKKWLSTINCDV